MAPDLPAPIAAYFAAANVFDPDATIACFASDATIHDDGETLAGHAQIRAWKERVFARYRSTAEVRRVAGDGSAYVVTAEVSGGFPGSPIALDYRFELRSGWFAGGSGHLGVLLGPNLLLRGGVHACPGFG